MGPGDILGMEPEIAGLGGFKCHQIVLAIIATDKNDGTGRKGNFSGLRRFGKRAGAGGSLEITGIGKFLNDFQQFLSGYRFRQGERNTLQIADIFLALLNLDTDQLLGPFGPGVFSVVALNIGHWRQRRIQFDFHLRRGGGRLVIFRIKVGYLNGSQTNGKKLKISQQQIGDPSIFIGILRFRQFLCQ